MLTKGVRLISFITAASLLKWTQCDPACSTDRPTNVIQLGAPEAKFVVGWPLALHEKGCLKLRPGSVQEMITAQWALSFWNQKQIINETKLSLAVFDTCATENGFTRAMVSFLQDATFYMMDQCTSGHQNMNSRALGLLLSPQTQHREDAFVVMKSMNIPIVTYAPENLFSLRNKEIQNVFATVPSLENYIEIATSVLKETHNNLINVIYDADILPLNLLQKILRQLDASQIHVYHVMPKQELKIGVKSTKFLSKKSTVVLAFVNYASLQEILKFCDEQRASKIFLSVPVGMSEASVENPPTPSTSSQLVLIRNVATSSSLVEFHNFFLDFVRKNPHKDPLIDAYVQAHFDCTLANGGQPAAKRSCGRLSHDEMSRRLAEPPASVVEPIVFAIYAFGSTLQKLHGHLAFRRCLESSYDEECLQLVSDSLKHLSYTFNATDDPPFLRSFNLKLEPSAGFLLGSVIRATHLTFETNGSLTSEPMAEYVVGYGRPIVYTGGRRPEADWHAKMASKSTCSYGLAECTKCTKITQWPTISTVNYDEPADLYILGLFDLNHWDQDAEQCINKIDTTSSNEPSLAPLAFVYVLETLKRKYVDLGLLQNVRLGGVVSDACRSGRRAARLFTEALTSDCLRMGSTTGLVKKMSNVTVPMFSIAAFVSGLSEQRHDIVRRLFTGAQSDTLTNGALLVSSTADPQPGRNFFNELVTMPDYLAHSQVLVNLLKFNRWDYFTAVVSAYDFSSLRAVEVFKSLMEENQLCLAEEIYLQSSENFVSPNKAAERNPSTKIVILFTTPQDAALYLKIRQEKESSEVIYIFFADSAKFEFFLDDADSHSVKVLALGSISIRPALTLDHDFLDFYSNVNPTIFSEPWFVSYWENKFQCTWSHGIAQNLTGNNFKKPCEKSAKLQSLEKSKFGGISSTNQVAYLVHSLESLIFAIDAIYKRLCPEQSGLCDEFFEQYHDLLNDFTRKVPKMDKFSIFSYRPATETVGKFDEIGAWSPKDGFSFSSPMVWYPHPDVTINASLPESSCRPPMCRCHLPDDFFTKPIVEDDNSAFSLDYRASNGLHFTDDQETPLFDDMKRAQNLFGGFSIKRDAWKKQPWTYVALAVVSLLLFSALGVLGLVVVKLLCGVIRGNQSLGICLLMGVVMLFTTSYFFIFDADPITCRLRYFGHSLSYCLCFGVMIAKACQLHNSETLGSIGHISFWNYWLLLFFIVAVQMALNLQWILARVPVVKTLTFGSTAVADSVTLKCSWNGSEFVASQSYVLLLLSMATFLAFVGRNVKRNYKETRFLLYTCSLCLPIWLVSCVLYLALPTHFQDFVVVGELLLCGSIILACMFGPKVYILLSYEPILLEYPPSVTLSKYNAHCAESSRDKAGCVASDANYFDVDDAASSPHGLFRESPLFNCGCSTKISGSQGNGSIRSNESSINCPSDTAICHSAIRKKQNNKKCKTTATPADCS